MDGYDVSGYVRSWGSLTNEHAQVGEPAVGDALNGFLPGLATNVPGPISSMMDNTTSGFHDKFKAANEIVVVSVAIGDKAIPASGDPVYAGEFELKNYLASGDEDIAISAEFTGSARATTLLYPNPWGNVTHALSAETGANSSTADHDHGASSAFGGYMAYHMTTSDGAVTIKVQDAATNSDGSFSDLLTSGSIDASGTPKTAIVPLAVTATVERYTRWQLALGGSGTATFFISFHRGKAT